MQTPWFREHPLDWTCRETKDVCAAITSVYTTTREVLTLAENSGLKQTALTTDQPVKYLVREVLAKARNADTLELLLAEVLADPEAAAVHSLIAATIRGWEAMLEAAVLRRRPSLTALSRLPPSARIVNPGGPERLLNAAADFADIAVFRLRLAEIEVRVARVEVDDAASGTGFLVGDRVLLTAWHVVESLAAQSGARGAARFDYKCTAAGQPAHAGRRIPFAADWLVASSPMASEADETSSAGPGLGTWDYALVRLSEPVGKQKIGDDSGTSSAEVRGHLPIVSQLYSFELDEPILVVGHPDCRPLQLSYASPGKARATACGNRVRYEANTGNGSSGSPVFNRSLRLVALHHYDVSSHNQGVPMSGIADDLRTRLAGRPELSEIGLG